ncbi:MAG: nitrogen fixation protein NifH [Candidatus Bathyarchaeia archaeon]
MAAQILPFMPWTDVLKVNPTEWLLEHENPSFRFWALQDLERKKRNHPEVVEAQEAVMESVPVKEIMGAQSPEGHWVEPKDMYLPKYKATTHSLLILAELGAKRTPAIERGIEHIFSFQRDSGHFLTDLPKTAKGRASTIKDGSCLDGNILYYMSQFGYLEDPRVKRLIDFIVDYHSIEEAGWRCRAYPIDPEGVFPVNCYMGAVKVLKAFSTTPKGSRSPEVKAVIDREVENILENRIYRYRRAADGSRKDKAGWKRFGFPLFYQSDALEVLDVLTRIGIRDERMQDALDLVLGAQGPDGRWLLKNTYNGKMWCDIEVKNKTSRWITLRALRVLRRFYGG